MIEIKAAERLVMIQAMSLNRKDAESKICSLADEFFMHVLKVYLFPKSTYVDGWCIELRAWYRKIRRTGANLKKGNFFSAKDYKKFLEFAFEFEVNTFHEHIEYVFKKNSRLKTKPPSDSNSVLKDIRKFYAFLADSLENNTAWLDVEKKLLSMANKRK